MTRLTYKDVRKFGQMTKPRLALVRKPYRWALREDYNKEVGPRFENLRAAYWWVQGYLSKQIEDAQ